MPINTYGCVAILCSIFSIRTPFAWHTIPALSTIFSITASRIYEQIEANIDMRHRGDAPSPSFRIEPAIAARDELELDLLAISAIKRRGRIGAVQR